MFPESPPSLILLFATLSNCDLLTASVEFVPAAKFVIGLLLISMPLALVTMPPTVVLFKPFKSLANLTHNLPSSLFTPMFSLVKAALSAPPRISKRLLAMLCLMTLVSSTFGWTALSPA